MDDVPSPTIFLPCRLAFGHPGDLCEGLEAEMDAEGIDGNSALRVRQHLPVGISPGEGDLLDLAIAAGSGDDVAGIDRDVVLGEDAPIVPRFLDATHLAPEMVEVAQWRGRLAAFDDANNLTAGLGNLSRNGEQQWPCASDEEASARQDTVLAQQ